MNTLTTFTGLSAEIPIWVNRNDSAFIERVPSFINLTQQRIFIDCPTLASQMYVKGNFTPNNNIVSVPGLWGSNLTLEYINSDTNKIVILQYVPYEYLERYEPTPGGISTQEPYPVYYSNMSIGYIKISPTPTAAYEFQLAYDTNSTQLMQSQQTNFITKNLYDLLFLGSMYYAYCFLEDATQSQAYEQRYKERVAAYLLYNMGRKNDRTADAMKD
jgi:hypothetical protein